LATVLAVARYAWLFSFLNETVSVGILVALYALVQATSFIVLTPGNIGVQELGFIGVAVLLGITAGAAAAGAVILRVSAVIATLSLALAMGGTEFIQAMQEVRRRQAPDA
jgi:uncharacterized membrane protein YbhN (UPF0104 family)